VSYGADKTYLSKESQSRNNCNPADSLDNYYIYRWSLVSIILPIRLGKPEDSRYM